VTVAPLRTLRWAPRGALALDMRRVFVAVTPGLARALLLLAQRQPPGSIVAALLSRLLDASTAPLIAA
jgi:hypothetical protein